MAEIKLFDTWTFQEEMPEPFGQFLQKEGLRKTTTIVEWLSQYNQGRQATLHPPTLRAMLSIAGIYLKQTEGALGFQKGNYDLLNFYCMEYAKKERRYALIYNPVSAKIRGMINDFFRCRKAKMKKIHIPFSIRVRCWSGIKKR